ncbi:YncE family protein [Nanoarchaeota archaeon]
MKKIEIIGAFIVIALALVFLVTNFTGEVSLNNQLEVSNQLKISALSVSGDVWAINRDGRVRKHNGTGWEDAGDLTSYGSSDYWGISVNSDNGEVWTSFPDDGTVIKYNGTGWNLNGTIRSGGSLYDWYTISVNSDNGEVWAINRDGHVRKHNGTGWETKGDLSSYGSSDYWGLSVNSDNGEVWAAHPDDGTVIVYNGTGWTENGTIRSGGSLYDWYRLSVDSSTGNAWAINRDGHVRKHNGTGWETKGDLSSYGSSNHWSLSVNSNTGEVWAVHPDDGTVIVYNGTGWTENGTIRSGGSYYDWYEISVNGATAASSPSTPSINYTEFTGETTNLTNVSDYGNISGVELINPEHGKISFTESLNLSAGADIDTHVNISFNRVEINSTALAALNKSARITFYNLTYDDPRPLINGVECSTPTCTEVSYDAATGIYVVDVTHFTIYSTEETPGPAPRTSTPPGSGSGGKCIPDYECGEWSDCQPRGMQERTCVDKWCGSEDEIETQECVYAAPVIEVIEEPEVIEETKSWWELYSNYIAGILVLIIFLYYLVKSILDYKKIRRRK